MPTAILVSHGQPSAPEAPEAALAALARDVAAELPEWDIRSATLSTPGRLEDVARDGAMVFPFFMASGWFTTKVLPRRLGETKTRILQPFGLDPNLPALAADAVRDVIAQQSWSVADVSVLLAAHGSARGPHAAAAAFSFAKALSAALPGPRINCGFVEQAPRIRDAAAPLPGQSLCLPFFAQAGDHVRDDVPEALGQAAFQGIPLPVVGALPGVATLIAQGLRSARSDSSS
ncbi:cobalamin biosynthesis protein CbiX [Epibacterium sp. SM1979]|uniref:Cobalamin biosynthesis protein CbiX n=1 Tax=Tritonibacter litoralis TaxID=2662264 RepID=A0A843YG06_9RHOB|nr:cobalamin biosynthesis protein CbiX [Tritonibacter litoralis]